MCAIVHTFPHDEVTVLIGWEDESSVSCSAKPHELLERERYTTWTNKEYRH